MRGPRRVPVPGALQQKLTLGFGLTHSGFPIQPITIPWSIVNNHKLTLSFTPATEADEQALAALIPEDAQTIDDLPTSLPGLIEVVPELKLDGEVIHTGTTGRNLGEELTLFNAVFFPGRGNATRPLSVIVGSYLTIGSESGSISSQTLEQLRSKVEQTKATLETEDPDQIATQGPRRSARRLVSCRDPARLMRHLFVMRRCQVPQMEQFVTERTGDVLDCTARMRDRTKCSRCSAWRRRSRIRWCIRWAPGYYAQYTALGNLMGLQSDGQMILQAGMGLHGYEPNVNTLFGFPRGISPGGVVFDLPIAGVQLTGGLEQEATARFNQQIGLLSSALEHAVPEQMFSTEDQPADAISAVKALSKANAQGQRIYQMTRDNMADTLPNLNLATETESEIRTALNAGLTVIAHTDNVSVPGWTGAGYIILDSDTGSGAYKISGGQNGGFNEPGGGAAAGLLFLGITGTAVPAIILLILAIFAIYQAILALIEITTILSDSGCPVELLILFGGIIALFVAIGLVFGTLGAVIMLFIGSLLAEKLARALVDAISRIEIFCPAARNS